MKLINMSDFVLDCLKNAPIEEYSQVNETFVNKVVNYANFLKQPLKLEMFVPLRQDGEILQEPIPKVVSQEQYPYDLSDYNEAKEKVLFEGFMSVDTRIKNQIYFALKEQYRISQIDYIMNDAFGLFFYDASNEKSRINTIEDLLNFSELQLTESAIKQITP